MRRALAVLLLLGVAGCARSPLFEQQVQTSYAEAAALDTLHDYEVARLASAAQLSRLEGLIAQERRDPELLALAARGWCRYAFYVAWDDRELAQELGDQSAALYHAERSLAGFERAAHYASELMELTAPGYDVEDADKLDQYLIGFFTEPEQASTLMWAGCAELGKALTDVDQARGARSRAAAQELLEHALYLDGTAGDGLAELQLAVALARKGEPAAVVASHLARARTQSQRRLLLVDVAEAVLVECKAGNERALVSRLEAVLRAPDVAPERRLDNLVAKRRARRYLESATFRAQCAKN